MISNPKLIFYVCTAKGTTVVAEYIAKEDTSNLQGLAVECLRKTPPLHSSYSHTVKKRTFTFLIEDPFVYFAISHEDLSKSEVLWFLNRIKSGIQEILDSMSLMDSDEFTPFCFQSQLGSIFSKALALDVEFMDSSRIVENDFRNHNLNSSVKGTMVTQPPLLRQTSKGLKNKKKVDAEAKGVVVDSKDAFENKVDVCDDIDSSLLRGLGSERQKARQIWKKHVLVVLLLDLFVCAVLFGIWLWVCRGFKCIDG